MNQNLGGANRIPAIFTVLISVWPIFRLLERLCHLNETTYRRAGTSCSPSFPGSCRWHFVLPTGLHRGNSGSFLGNLPNNHSLSRSFVLHSNGHVSCTSIIRHPRTPVPRGTRISSCTSLKRTTVDLHPYFLACYDEVSNCILTTCYVVLCPFQSLNPPQWLTTFVKRLYRIIGSFDAKTVLGFLSSIRASVFRLTKVATGAVNKVENRNCFHNPLASALCRKHSVYGCPAFLWQLPFVAGPTLPAPRHFKQLIICWFVHNGTTFAEWFPATPLPWSTICLVPNFPQ